MTTEAARYYLAAMIDGEGWIELHKNKVSHRVAIANTDEGILVACEEALNVLNIPHYRYAAPSELKKLDQGKPPCYKIYIRGKEGFEKVLNTVPLKHTGKLERLRIAVKSRKEAKGKGNAYKGEYI